MPEYAEGSVYGIAEINGQMVRYMRDGREIITDLENEEGQGEGRGEHSALSGDGAGEEPPGEAPGDDDDERSLYQVAMDHFKDGDVFAGIIALIMSFFEGFGIGDGFGTDNNRPKAFTNVIHDVMVDTDIQEQITDIRRKSGMTEALALEGGSFGLLLDDIQNARSDDPAFGRMRDALRENLARHIDAELGVEGSTVTDDQFDAYINTMKENLQQTEAGRAVLNMSLMEVSGDFRLGRNHDARDKKRFDMANVNSQKAMETIQRASYDAGQFLAMEQTELTPLFQKAAT